MITFLTIGSILFVSLGIFFFTIENGEGVWAGFISVMFGLLIGFIAFDDNQDKHANEQPVYKMKIQTEYIVSPNDTTIVKTDTTYQVYN